MRQVPLFYGVSFLHPIRFAGDSTSVQEHMCRVRHFYVLAYKHVTKNTAFRIPFVHIEPTRNVYFSLSHIYDKWLETLLHIEKHYILSMLL